MSIWSKRSKKSAIPEEKWAIPEVVQSLISRNHELSLELKKEAQFSIDHGRNEEEDAQNGFDIGSGDYISFSEVSTWKAFRWREIGVKARARRLPFVGHGENLYIEFEMEKGGLIKAHVHDCIELIVLGSGKMQDVVSNQILEPQTSYSYTVNKPHGFRAIERSTGIVQYRMTEDTNDNDSGR